MTSTAWTKARMSGTNGGSCVEVRRRNDTIEVRDSKDHGNGPVLRFSTADWAAFLDGAKNQEFDRPTPRR